MEKLEFKFELKEISPLGRFEGWASTYDLDLGNDKVLPGAFKTSIRKTDGKIPVLLNHDRNSVVGVGEKAQEDHKGLWVEAQMAMNVQRGRETYELMEMGALTGLSIGFKIQPGGFVMDGKVRLLKTIELMEYSVTPFPLNTEAKIMRVKSVEDITTARELEEALREVGFSKKEALCLMAKGGNQLLKERREAGSNGEDEVPDEAESMLFDLKNHIADLSAKHMLESLSQHIT